VKEKELEIEEVIREYREESDQSIKKLEI